MKDFNISIRDNQSKMTTTVTKVSAKGLKKLLTKIITDNSPSVKLLFKEAGKRNVKTSKTVTDKNYCLEDNISLKSNNNE